MTAKIDGFDSMPRTDNLNRLQDAASLVYKAMLPTPQIAWPLLAERLGCEVWVKHENHTPVGSFKVRGGLVYMNALKASSPDCAGVVSATRGNHGQSVGFAANRAGIKATIVVPQGNSQGKNAAMRALGVELIEHGQDLVEASDYASHLALTRKLHRVPSFHPLLVDGVASACLEFLTSAPELDTVYVSIGLGSGICAMIAARDALGLKTKIVGVVSENIPSYALSFEAGRTIAQAFGDTIADGIACRVPCPEALEIILKGADRVITVSDELILRAMAIYYIDTHNLAEGAGAAPLAGLLKERPRMLGKRVGVMLSGGNVDWSLFQSRVSPYILEESLSVTTSRDSLPEPVAV
jgi:threonine dehydratase